MAKNQKLSQETQKSTIGMTSIRENILKADDVCSILKVCKRSGVSEFEFGNLRVKFSLTKEHDIVDNKVPRVSVSAEPEQMEFSTSSLENTQELLDQLAIDDPLAHEKMILNTDLEQYRMLNEKA